MNHATHETTKPREKQGFDGAGWLLKDYLVTPTGIEQPAKSLGKSVVLDSVPPPVPPSLPIELVEIWAKLDEPARRDLLAVARGWVKVEP